MLRLTAAFVAGLLMGILLWQQFVVSKLESENQTLREQSRQAESLREENARLARERIDPAELQRWRDGQAELLRLRGQAAQLRREAQEAKAAAARALAQSVAQVASTNPPASDPPVDAFTANVMASVGWKDTLVTGGWRLASGKRAFLLLNPGDVGDNSVNVACRLIELPDELLAGLGLAKFRANESASAATGLFSVDQTRTLFEQLKNTAGVDILNAPQVITPSGRQAQVQVTDVHTLPSGQTYTTGPVIDIVPTISADKQTVELVVGARLNLPRTPSGP